MTTLSNRIPWLSDALLQCTALLILVLLTHRIFKHSSAAKQHALLLSGALGIPFLLIFSAVLPTYHIRPSERSPHLQEKREPTFISTTELGSPILNTSDSLAGSPSIIDDTNQPTQALPESSPLPLTFWLAVIWILGILLGWLRLGIGVISLCRIKTSLPDARSHKILAEESTNLGLQKAPLLILLDDQLHAHDLVAGKTHPRASRIVRGLVSRKTPSCHSARAGSHSTTRLPKRLDHPGRPRAPLVPSFDLDSQPLAQHDEGSRLR